MITTGTQKENCLNTDRLQRLQSNLRGLTNTPEKLASKNKNGLTPLEVAAKYGFVDIARNFLLYRQCNQSIVSKSLQIAEKNGNQQMIDLLSQQHFLLSRRAVRRWTRNQNPETVAIDLRRQALTNAIVKKPFTSRRRSLQSNETL